MTTPLSLSPSVDETGGIANVAYNGFRFPLMRHAKVSFSPEMSDDGRTTKYVRMDLSIEFIYVPTDTHDEHLTTYSYNKAVTTDGASYFPLLRQALTNPGQELRFQSQGIGQFSIQDGTRFDVNNGPKPRIVSEIPIAGSRALRVNWECSTWFPSCSTQLGDFGIAQFPYSVSWGIGDNGITVRTISGSIEIPLSRTARDGFLDAATLTRRSADQFREDFITYFPAVLGFKRNQNFNLSQDRKTLNFTITDSEIPSDNPYFPGIVKQEVRRRYASDWKTGFTKWMGAVSGSIEVAPGYSKLRAWIAFTTIFDDIFKKRLDGMMPATAQTDPKTPGETSGSKKSWGIVTSISIDENLYGRDFSFSFTYILFCSLKDLFKATGLFTPLSISANDVSWNLWKSSMSVIQGPRGWRDLGFKASDDVIVDLCNPIPRRINTDQNLIPQGEKEKKSNGEKPEGTKPENSFIGFDSKIHAVIEDGLVHSVPLQRSAPLNESASLNKPTETETKFNQFSSGGEVLSKPTLHRIRPTVYKFIFSGTAARVGYPVPVPNLQSIGGVKAISCGRDEIISKVVGTGTDVATGQPLTVYGLYWRKEYILEDAPKTGSINSDGHLGMYT